MKKAFEQIWVRVASGIVLAGLGSLWVLISPRAQDLVSVPLWALLAMVAAGCLIGAGFCWLVMRKNPALKAPPAENPKHKPDALERECIRVLRLADENYLLPADIVGYLAERTAASDVREALNRLHKVGWVSYFIGSDGATYRLVGPGVDYARKEGMNTAALPDMVGKVSRTSPRRFR